MKPELRPFLFTMTVLFFAPALYWLGDWLGGLLPALGLPTVAILATWRYAEHGSAPNAGAPRSADGVGAVRDPQVADGVTAPAAPPPAGPAMHAAPAAPPRRFPKSPVPR